MVMSGITCQLITGVGRALPRVRVCVCQREREGVIFLFFFKTRYLHTKSLAPARYFRTLQSAFSTDCLEKQGGKNTNDGEGSAKERDRLRARCPTPPAQPARPRKAGGRGVARGRAPSPVRDRNERRLRWQETNLSKPPRSIFWLRLRDERWRLNSK